MTDLSAQGNQEPHSHGEKLVMSWKWIGLAGVVAAIASLGTLAIIASVSDVDTLSTVALALAILAFVVQILVYIAQTWAANEQVKDSQRINAETRGLLAELTTRTRDTSDVLNRQYTKVLDRLLDRTEATVESLGQEGASLGDIRLQLSNELKELFENARTELATSVPGSSTGPEPPRTPSPRERYREVLGLLSMVIPQGYALIPEARIGESRFDAVIARSEQPISADTVIAIEIASSSLFTRFQDWLLNLNPELRAALYIYPADVADSVTMGRNKRMRNMATSRGVRVYAVAYTDGPTGYARLSRAVNVILSEPVNQE